MFLGKASAALDLLSEKGKGGVLSASDPVNPDDPASPSVVEVLRSKHPPAQPAQPATAEALIPDHQMPPQEHPVIFDRIDASWIHSAALNTKGAADPSGLDAHFWRCLYTSLHSAFWDLCHALALFTRRLCTAYVGLSAFLACHLIALDKCPGVRPIGVCETARRIIS